MSFAGYFLSVLFCLLSMLISDSRFDLVWFRLSCDHGWIRSGSVNVRKQQQQQQQPHQVYFLFGDVYIRARFTACCICICVTIAVLYTSICKVIKYSKGNLGTCTFVHGSLLAVYAYV